MVIITGTVASVPVSVEIRYAEGVLAQSAHRPSRVPRLPYVGRNQRLPRVPLPRTAQQVACEKSRAPPLPRVADHLAYPKSRAPLPRTIVRLASPLRPSIAVIVTVEVRVPSGPRFPTTATSSSPEDRSAAGSRPSATGSSPEDRSAKGVRAGLSLDAPLGAGTLAAGALTLLVVTAVDSSGRLDFGTDNLEVDRLVLGLLGFCYVGPRAA